MGKLDIDNGIVEGNGEVPLLEPEIDRDKLVVGGVARVLGLAPKSGIERRAPTGLTREADVAIGRQCDEFSREIAERLRQTREKEAQK